MFVRVWRFTVGESDRAAFEASYGPEGDWARLFARGDHYLGTELLLGTTGAHEQGAASYVTIDRWRVEADWLRFLKEHGDEYRALDRRCERLTADETEIGAFKAVP